MATTVETAINQRRPFLGYEVEPATFDRRKDSLLREAEGKYVVIVGDEVVGPVESFEEALRAGYRRFGLGPLYIKQILAEEPRFEISRAVVPCPI